jgi:hypothetical protein
MKSTQNEDILLTLTLEDFKEIMQLPRTTFGSICCLVQLADHKHHYSMTFSKKKQIQSYCSCLLLLFMFIGMGVRLVNSGQTVLACTLSHPWETLTLPPECSM